MEREGFLPSPRILRSQRLSVGPYNLSEIWYPTTFLVTVLSSIVSLAFEKLVLVYNCRNIEFEHSIALEGFYCTGGQHKGLWPS